MSRTCSSNLVIRIFPLDLSIEIISLRVCTPESFKDLFFDSLINIRMTGLQETDIEFAASAVVADRFNTCRIDSMHFGHASLSQPSTKENKPILHRAGSKALRRSPWRWMRKSRNPSQEIRCLRCQRGVDLRGQSSPTSTALSHGSSRCRKPQ